MSAFRAFTLLNRGPKNFLNHLSKLREEHNNHVLMFALSSNAPDIEVLLNRINSLWPESIGCLSSAPPKQSIDPNFSCSLAFFPKDSCTTFRSTIEGKQPAQVGRRHAFRRLNEEHDLGRDRTIDSTANWEALWKERPTSSSLPPKLGASRIQSVLFFSDSSPQGLSAALQDAHPDLRMLGLISASTPFLNGHPFTLYRNNELFSDGAVGLALPDMGHIITSTFFGELTPLSETVVISECEGNLIHSLGNSNPSKYLLDALQEANKSRRDFKMKGTDFFVGVTAYEHEIDFYPEYMYKVISTSDPLKGTMAIEQNAVLSKGMRLQFYYESERDRGPPDTPRKLLKRLGSADDGQVISIVNKSTKYTYDPVPHEDEPSDIIDNVFSVYSENGFVISQANPDIQQHPFYFCTTPGTHVDRMIPLT